MEKGLKFFFGVVLIGSAVYFLLQSIMPFLQDFTALQTVYVMRTFGVMATASQNFIVTDLYKATVLPLCVGDIEIAVLLGAILSTADRAWKQRLKGAVAALLFVFSINPIRIALTLSSWQWFGVETAEFLHSILFRITLLIVIIGFYVAWYLRPWEKVKNK